MLAAREDSDAVQTKRLMASVALLLSSAWLWGVGAPASGWLDAQSHVGSLHGFDFRLN